MRFGDFRPVPQRPATLLIRGEPNFGGEPPMTRRRNRVRRALGDHKFQALCRDAAPPWAT